MAIFLTGATGYIGGYVAARLLEQTPERLNLLVRARDREEAARRIWHAWQLHMDFPAFRERLDRRLELFVGDLTEPRLGLDEAAHERLAATTDSVIHAAATLNRKSEKSCLNVNLRGTLAVIQLAARANAQHRLRRFSHVSTVAVAGARQNTTIDEDRAIDWERSDYDPYARTKKFAEHMLRELLPDTPRTIFRPSIVLGDSQRPETTQFDMVRAFVFLAGLPVLPFRPDDRLDIVPVNYVADAIAALHQKERPEHEIYHLSAGADSETYRAVTTSLAAAQRKRPPIFFPSLERPFTAAVNLLSDRSEGALGHGASLLKVFLPYLVWNTVFENTRVVQALGRKPATFSSYCYALLRYSRENHFRYPYREWPDGPERLWP